MTALDEVMARATADPVVRGVVLTGSHARGLGTGHSDYDVVVVVAERTAAWQRTTRSAELDEIIYTVDDLANTEPAWQRYAFRGAPVLLDRLDGGIAALVTRQAVPTAEESAEAARESLDGYVNQLYRAAKSRRDGAVEAARLDEVESLPWMLQTVFALQGRLRPYNKYLGWELLTFPLAEPWNTALAPDRVLGNVVRLFPAVEELARERGHGDVLDEWGADLDLIRRSARI